MTETTERESNPISEIAEHMGDTKIAPAHGIAAIALNMAMKYHDFSTIQDGALYQQYKLEGRTMRAISLDMVFETAIRIEAHLLASSDRIAALVVDAIAYGAEQEAAEAQKEDQPDDDQSTVQPGSGSVIE